MKAGKDIDLYPVSHVGPGYPSGLCIENLFILNLCISVT